jgi:hypothetical protein
MPVSAGRRFLSQGLSPQNKDETGCLAGWPWVVKMGGKSNCFEPRFLRFLRLPGNKPIDVQALKE